MSPATCFLLGSLGALAYELIRLYELMGKLPKKKFVAMLRWPVYLGLTLGLVAASGFISWAINANTEPTVWQLVVAGIGARSLVSKPIEFNVKRIPLGDSEPALQSMPTLGDIFA